MWELPDKERGRVGPRFRGGDDWEGGDGRKEGRRLGEETLVMPAKAGTHRPEEGRGLPPARE